MISQFQHQGITIESVEFCPHLPTDNCNCRKPKTGMIENILASHTIDLQHSCMIGDKQSDIDLAHNINIKNSIAINAHKIQNASYSFPTILACKEYLEENQDTIL